MEKVLTTEPEEFERYLKENEDSDILEERNKPESYAYGEVKNIICIYYMSLPLSSPN